MATLVQFLAAGVNGAPNGTATFVLRGTASSAAGVMWNEFEELTQPATNIVTLDANGAAEIYCDAYVDVTIKNFAGTTLRTVTVGNSAPVVEVISPSFTGTGYSGGGDTVNLPVTLKAVLDRWIDSAGAPDWQVDVGGVATDLDSAFASFTGMFVNVKDPAYGAVGDGVTDDTTAILAATNAAAGGIVFFPKGTYKISTLSLSGTNINWLGSGAGSSIISGNTSTNLINLTDNTNTAWKNFSGLSFTSSGSYTRLFLLEETQNVSFKNCAFDCSQCAADAIELNDEDGLSKLLVTDCDFVVGASTVSAIRNQAATSARSISVKGCTFSVPSGFTGRILRGADFNVTGCRFDASAVTSGTYYHIDPDDATSAGKYIGVVTGNKFFDGGSSGYAFRLSSVTTASYFTEDNNIFVGFTEPTLLTEKGHLYDYSNNAGLDATSKIGLGSRVGRSGSFTHSSGGSVANILANLVYDTIYINHTQVDDSAFTFSSQVPIGLKWSLGLDNNSGGTRSLGFGVTGIAAATSVASTETVYGDYFAYFNSGVKIGRTDLAVG